MSGCWARHHVIWQIGAPLAPARRFQGARADYLFNRRLRFLIRVLLFLPTFDYQAKNQIGFETLA